MLENSVAGKEDVIERSSLATLSISLWEGRMRNDETRKCRDEEIQSLDKKAAGEIK